MHGEKGDYFECLRCGDLFLRRNYELICRACARVTNEQYGELECLI